ncbi:hypothetical protein [uncultured Maribacter sp.]|uniref:hypothetical protein n=1 Tax=uncultured Maribacter sp. TaxID=431308 RepID=UPI0026077BF3|nr:hypothetical protein [uncultured Maribacter sp.]
MTTITFRILGLALFFSGTLLSQEHYEDKVKDLQQKKALIVEQEKEALKEQVEFINQRLSTNEISYEEAKELKEKAAKRRALNIEERVAIITNKISLIERNYGEVLVLKAADSSANKAVGISIDLTRGDGSTLQWEKRQRKKQELKYDRRTYSDFVIAVGLNNVIEEGKSIQDTPYKVGRSRFFELGWQWRTRVFKNSNFMRLNYGVSFQFNGLKPKNNQYFVLDSNNQTVLEEFDVNLDKSKLRMDNLVFPVHLEFGPSKFDKSEKKIRYSIHNKFRLGLGAYGGFNLSTRQKLKYTRNGESIKEKLKRSYNTNSFVYGVSAYAGFDGALLYVKYDLNPIFKDAGIKQNNISLGLRFDL